MFAPAKFLCNSQMLNYIDQSRMVHARQSQGMLYHLQMLHKWSPL